jgi:hypothetical protein
LETVANCAFALRVGRLLVLACFHEDSIQSREIPADPHTAQRRGQCHSSFLQPKVRNTQPITRHRSRNELTRHGSRNPRTNKWVCRSSGETWWAGVLGANMRSSSMLEANTRRKHRSAAYAARLSETNHGQAEKPTHKQINVQAQRARPEKSPWCLRTQQ